eukprot:scaffold7582_cov72-Phaeocystis_antarctica.AAC.10
MHLVVVVVRRLGLLIEGQARGEHIVARQGVAAAERGRDVGIADPVVGDHVGRRVDCRQQRDGEQQLLHGFLRTPTSDTLNVLPAGRVGWVGRGMERAREAACVVRRVQCVVRGRSLCRRAEEQLTVMCVETAALDEGVWIWAETCTLLCGASSEAISFEPATARVTRWTSAREGAVLHATPTPNIC